MEQGLQRKYENSSQSTNNREAESASQVKQTEGMSQSEPYETNHSVDVDDSRQLDHRSKHELQRPTEGNKESPVRLLNAEDAGNEITGTQMGNITDDPENGNATVLVTGSDEQVQECSITDTFLLVDIDKGQDVISVHNK